MTDWYHTFQWDAEGAAGGDETQESLEEMLRVCMYVERGDCWCAFLVGGNGNGKTHLGIAALNEWQRQGNRGGRFVKVPDWLALMRRHAVPEEGQIDAEQLLDNYARCPFLVLDDLGAERVTSSGYGGELLYRLIDRRYDARLRTIVTSNARQDDLDLRIASRLREGLVVCAAPDYRGRAP